ncbi:MAG: patatin-like phospholipase family protein, partial [Candidatus Eisenbacteria bacterium]
TTLQAAFPLSEGSPGCGLNEICRSCSLPPELRTAGAVTRPQRLRLRSRFEAEKKSPTSPAIPPTDPKVALVWSGGVFRGVFQIGAMAGLSVLRKPPKGADGVWPHLIAGASVGSITAAMNYALFRGAEAHRPTFIQRLATAFIVIDRLVVTDRFADFIRGTALRASDVRFSIREADRVFRRFDDAAGEQWSEEAREVLAGIERLFRVSPFETKALVEALRAGDNGRATKLCGDYFQWWLDRAGVGREVLGAEPLEHLIQDYVLAPLAETLQLRDQAAAASYPVCDLSRTGPAFLATATNLTAGRLELLGAPGPYKHAALLPSLLASSAFPGVFRPRWAWEVLAGAQQAVQFTDGGVMDNLPLDAACSRLAKEAEAGTVAWCPTAKGRAVPHLLFTVSLEPEVERLEGEALTRVASTWIDVQKRAGQFGYNHKIHAYAAAQTAIREIRAARRAEAPAPASDDVARERAQANAEGLRDLLDVEVLAITPLWTCGTFGFHPMLGFRQERQVENIAHGCKRTLETFREFDQMTEGQSRVHEGWMDAWGLNASTLSNWSQKADPTRAKGGCWYSPDIQCPFALATEQDHPASAEVRNAANRVYLACKKDTTHMPPEKRRRK